MRSQWPLLCYGAVAVSVRPAVGFSWMLGIACSWVAPAFAQGAPEAGDLAGAWQAGPMRIQVRVRSWGPDCGPRPPEHSREPGGRVRISAAGDVLVLAGAVEGRSDQCWTPNRAVRRVAASSEPGRWTAVCRTPPSDPRQERGRYEFVAADSDTLRFSERSEYDWKLRASRCQAVRTASRTFRRVDGGSQAAASASDREGARGRSACVPGAPRRLLVRSVRRAIEPGQSWCPRLVRADANGCPLPGRVVDATWQVTPGEVARFDERGCLLVTPEAEGQTLELTARAGELSTTVSVQVRRLGLAALIAGSVMLDDAGVEREVREASEAARPSRKEAASAAEVQAAPDARSGVPWWWFALGGGGLLFAFVVLGWTLRRAHRAEQGGGSGEAPDDATSLPVVTSETEGAGSLEGAPVPQVSPGGHGAAGAVTLVCPRCRRTLPAGASCCPHDGTEGVPYEDFVARQRTSTLQPGQRCPRCGKTYPAAERFCGEDGTPLVPIRDGS